MEIIHFQVGGRNYMDIRKAKKCNIEGNNQICLLSTVSGKRLKPQEKLVSLKLEFYSRI